MASAAHAALLRAIEGFKGSTAGSKEHEELNTHLARVYELARGGRKDPHDDSPGRREAAAAAFQKEMPNPREESGGNVRSVQPHGFSREFSDRGDGPGMIAPEHNAEPGRVTRAAGIRTAGNRYSALPSGGYPEGEGTFRTVAAARAAEKMHEPQHQRVGDNVHSNPPGPSRPEGGQIGNVSAPAKAGPNLATGDWERVPGYVAKERLGRDQYERAAEGVRKRFGQPTRAGKAA